MKLLFEAIGNLLIHKTRSLLAALGIIFVVASVICMLSISEVARQDVVQRIQRMGVNNVILDSVEPEESRAANRARSSDNDNETKFVKFGVQFTRHSSDVSPVRREANRNLPLIRPQQR